MSAAAPSAVDRIARPAADAPAEAPELFLLGSIVDSWVEPAGSCDWDSRLVLQVVPRGRPRELLTVEADAVLVPDLGWLADLGENLCHGSPVRVKARRSRSGDLEVTELDLDR
ncbi:hypothetical protein [Tautonia plasticadhaerens]|uniref:Uncharacterized protein n=1 Tax=Tautonia plasticadhaerens TaxID=2527974 RepID=A0A518HBI1_9BACT|nr:hypothetical protein [Tautonia plasticadhaerens]QDV38180.1 hypothetical protein ElP_61310 [Tautonia plasticadhaerens]